ncbi:MAG: toll/interleukin-1 receptor domain-containing protein [Verrucomicrobiia bacterium]
MAGKDTFDYDVFISYSSKDKDWVRGELLKRIEKTGLRAFIDFRDFTRGASSIKEMERGVRKCRKTLLILTPDYIKSEWCELEEIMVQSLTPANRKLRVIPLLKKKCKKPLRVGALTHIDFTDGADLDLAWRQLLTALGKPPKPVAPKEPKRDVRFLAHPHPIPRNEPFHFQLLEAVWGVRGQLADVTGIVQGIISTGTTIIRASTQVFGDPVYGRAKTLLITYSDGEARRTVMVQEGEAYNLPTAAGIIRPPPFVKPISPQPQAEKAVQLQEIYKEFRAARLTNRDITGTQQKFIGRRVDWRLNFTRAESDAQTGKVRVLLYHPDHRGDPFMSCECTVLQKDFPGLWQFDEGDPIRITGVIEGFFLGIHIADARLEVP